MFHLYDIEVEVKRTEPGSKAITIRRLPEDIPVHGWRVYFIVLCSLLSWERFRPIFSNHNAVRRRISEVYLGSV